MGLAGYTNRPMVGLISHYSLKVPISLAMKPMEVMSADKDGTILPWLYLPPMKTMCTLEVSIYGNL